MKYIRVGRDRAAIVDDADYERLSAYRWQAHELGRRRTVYAQRRGVGRRHHFMHRDVLPPPPGREVDHINGDGLDNRRCNLRLATRSQNSMNRGPNRNNTTGYKGVRFDKNQGKYVAGVKVNYAFIHLGSYDTAEDAARAYDRGARALHGDFAWLNFK